MTKKITSLLIAVAAITTLFFISSAPAAFIPPSSGGIAETKCFGSGCHNGSGAGVGDFEITGLPTSYIPGQSYSAQICITDPTSTIKAAGFSMYQSDFVNNAFSPGDATSYLTAAGVYLTHNGKKFFAGGSDTACWDFVWNAPVATSGTKTIGAAGNAVNDSGGPDTGDHGDFLLMVDVPEGPLPVDLVDLSLSVNEKNTISLDWETASEINNEHFLIERSYNVREFEVIGKVEGAGNTSESERYSFIDENPELNRPVYYRLKQVDFDGAYEYSLIKKIMIEQSAINIQKVYPNPVFSSETVKVKFDLLTDAREIDMIVYDILGHQKMKNTFTVSNGENIINFSPNNLVSGQYYVSLIANNQRIMSDMFIVTE